MVDSEAIKQAITHAATEASKDAVLAVIEQKDFKMAVMNTFLTRYYGVNDVERVLIIKNWLGRKGI